jgi:GABA(A) receptor-associated protein
MLSAADVQHLQNKYPDKVPVIVSRAADSKLPDIDQRKYLVHNEATVGQFLFIVRQRVQLEPHQALFFLVNGTVLAPVSKTVRELYDEYADEHVLHLVFREESTFGLI